MESWHNHLNSLFMKAHQNIGQFCVDLAEEWNFIEMNIEKVLSGAPKKEIFDPITKRAQAREERILMAVINMGDFEDCLDFLRNMSHAMRFK